MSGCGIQNPGLSEQSGDVIRTIEGEIGEKDIFTRKRSRKYTPKRKAAAYICRQYLYMPCRDICAALGGISYAALSKQFHLASEEIKKKEGCYQEFKEMAEMLKLKVKT